MAKDTDKAEVESSRVSAKSLYEKVYDFSENSKFRSEATTSVAKSDTRYRTLQDQYSSLEEQTAVKINELKSQIHDVSSKQINIIETIGIFVALFTFVSTEFAFMREIMREMKDVRLIGGFTLILLGSLIFFSIALDLVLKGSYFSLPLSANSFRKFKLEFSENGVVVNYKILLLLLAIFSVVFGTLTIIGKI